MIKSTYGILNPSFKKDVRHEMRQSKITYQELSQTLLEQFDKFIAASHDIELISDNVNNALVINEKVEDLTTKVNSLLDEIDRIYLAINDANDTIQNLVNYRYTLSDETSVSYLSAPLEEDAVVAVVEETNQTGDFFNGDDIPSSPSTD